MTEAERFLAEKVRRAEKSARGFGVEKNPVQNVQADRASPAGGTPATPASQRDSGGKAWGVGMAVFGVLMTMFWMAMFKGGCR